MKKMKRRTAVKATDTPPVGMPNIAGHVYEPESPHKGDSQPLSKNVAINPDAKMYGNVSGCCSKPVATGKSGSKGMDY